MTIKSTLNRIKEGFRTFLALDKQTLANIRMGLVIFLLIDLFGVYWYLKLPKVGFVVFLFILLALTIVVMAENRDIIKIPTLIKEDNENDRTK